MRDLAVTRGSNDLHVFTPEKTGAGDSALDAWDSESALLAVLRTPTGELLGVLSLDAPFSGRIPGHAQRAVVDAYVALAAARLNDVHNQTGLSHGSVSVP